MCVQKTALITGVTGQDGVYLTKLLLEKSYRVIGLRQPVSFDDTDRLSALIPDWQENPQFKMEYGDMTDGASLQRVISHYMPDEIYNLAGQSHVHISFDVPEMSAQVNALGPLRILECIKSLAPHKRIKFFQASTSEIFGNAPAPQAETTPMHPRSPYAIAKHTGYQYVQMYREAYGIYAVNGIMFNHESPLRGDEFVTQKIVQGIARIFDDRQSCLYLGNLNASRDWTHASDIMRGAWMMMQQEKPQDFVLASGVTRSVKNFVESAFRAAGITIAWRGHGAHEVGFDATTGFILVKVDPQFFRPLDVEHLCGDSTKAREVLDWAPIVEFETLVAEMVASALFVRQESARVQSAR